MSAYRKFWLVNGNGQTWYLTDDSKQKCFLSDPSGLGFEKSISTTRLGNNEIVDTTTLSMPEPSGTLIFYDTVSKAYQLYFSFVNFIAIEPLYYYYQPPYLDEKDSYYCEVELVSLEKGQYDKDEGLQCEFQLHSTSFWRKDEVYVISTDATDPNIGKYYDLVRPYYYQGSSLSDITVYSNGTLPSGCVIEVDGTMVNPQITFSSTSISEGSKVTTPYGVIRLKGTFDKAIVNSHDDEESITLIYNDEEIYNAIAYQDFGYSEGKLYETFVKLKPGENHLYFYTSNTFAGTFKISWKDEFVTV